MFPLYIVRNGRGRRAPGTHYSPSVFAGGVLSTPGQACVLAELDSLDAEIEGLHVSLHDAAVKFGVDVVEPSLTEWSWRSTI